MHQALRLGTFLVLAIGIVSGSPAVAFAQEQKEHPAEHAEKLVVTKESLADAIEDWVTHQTELLGGYFFVWDAEDEKALVLRLDKVHRERVARLSDEVYFACADFTTKDGEVYDLDMFMAPEGGKLVTTEVKVHKKEGKPRYTWHEKDGVWSTKPVE
jgi:hypothetical protein